MYDLCSEDCWTSSHLPLLSHRCQNFSQAALCSHYGRIFVWINHMIDCAVFVWSG